MSRVCEWCGVPLAVDAPESKKTCSDSHRAYRHRWLNRIPRSGGRPPVAPPAGSPLLAARKPSKSSGMQVSYRKALDAVAAALTGPPLHIPEHHARRVAEAGLRDALPARQRERMEAQDG